MKIVNDDLAKMLSLTRAALKDLAARNGTFWKEAVGELQSQYNEIPIWVLLYEDGDILKTHAALCETLRPHMAALAPLQIVLFYELVIGEAYAGILGNRTFAARLAGNDAVFSAGTGGEMDLTWFRSSLGTVFEARDSKRKA